MSVRNASLSIYYGNIDAQKWSLVSVNNGSEGNPFPVLVGVEGGQKGGLRSGSGDGGGHGDGGGVPGRRVGWGLVLGQEKWRVRGEGASARRKGEGRGELQGRDASSDGTVLPCPRRGAALKAGVGA